MSLLIHLHIPKNAGTTLSRMLKLKMGVWPPHKLIRHRVRLGLYDVDGLDERIEAINALPAAQRRLVCFFEAHCGYGVHERLPGPCEYITVLREPVDRALSVYYHMIEEGHLAADVPLETYIREGDPQRVWWVDNAQVRYLAGERGDIVDAPHGTVDPGLLEVAKHRLETFAWVGVMERFDASLLFLAKRMGWPRVRYGRSNVTQVRKRRHEVDPGIVELLEERNQLDAALHQWAAHRLERQIEAAGSGFDAALARFRRANARYDATVGRAYDLLPAARNVLTGRILRR